VVKIPQAEFLNMNAASDYREPAIVIFYELFVVVSPATNN